MRTLLLVTAALAALASSAAQADEFACPNKISPELMTALGDAAGWMGPGQAVHKPANMTMIGLPVSYVVATHAGGTETGDVTELDYRLQGATRPYGQRFPTELRKAFDKGFPGSNCGTQATSCAINFTGTSAGQLTDAELSEGDLSMPKDAHGDALSLVQADLKLDSADPVFLDCVYKAAK